MKSKTADTAQSSTQETDGAYLLKIVLYVVLAAIWLRFPEPVSFGSLTLYAFPVGFFVGLLFASHDHFRVDRKIEYVVLIIATILSVFLPTGIFL